MKKKENQEIIVKKIIEKLRTNGEWGKHGLFAKIGKKTGFSPAYVGQVFNGNKPIRESFVEKMADYLGVPVELLRRGTDKIDNAARGSIDLVLLERIVKTVEEFLKKDGTFDMPGEKKNELIKLLYNKYSGREVDIKESEILSK
ncbi:helix-turn-helix domain-containing protein [uncultured Desulfobulbus sp.]|uniref:helix-turn-helix domain-containing protein n=1 Tax=uncultured Desulfobulbus sp. TaxID=239745 RepID=UPI00374DB159